MKDNHSYFKNKSCEYFPCHECGDDFFNCLFCYCPLYAMGDDCGGNFVYTKDGIKDCSGCLLPHSPEGYDYIIKQIADKNSKE